MNDHDGALRETCRALLESGQLSGAVRELLSASREDVADLLLHWHQAENLRRGLEAAAQELRMGRCDRAIEILSGFGPESGNDLLALAVQIQDLSRYAFELSRGNLSAAPPPRQNYIAMSVKSLHSKLNHLVWQIDQVAHGDYNQTAYSMGELSDGLNWMTSRLRMKKLQADYEMEHDVTTGLLNRDAFMRKVYAVIQEQPDKCGVMLCGGLDNIKYVNETYGHEAGDRYILAAAKTLGDYEKAGLAARISGDEFSVYMHGYAQEVDIDALGKDLNEKISGVTVHIGGDPVKIRASFGAALYPQDAFTVDNLMKFSSHTMFEVKNSNRGALMRFSAVTYQKKANLFDRQEKLNQLIDEKHIRFVFQPIFRLEDRSLYGYEALMRPCTEDFSGPLDILALAEAQSKLSQIETVTFELIFAWIAGNLPKLKDLRIFFNTISTQYMTRDKLLGIHPQYEEICKYIVFEVLENTADSETFLREINAFRQQMDVKVAIDDYGCGYSNDLRLISVSPNIVKIDRFFIKEIHNDHDRQQLLQKIILYCKAKGIETLAEGVETLEELETSVQLGFTYAQGYYLGMPGEFPA